LNEYKQCEILVCFVSTAIEVDTHKLIRHALDNGKAVAVPRCIDGTSLMQFYLINSLDDLEPGSFSVLEPIVDRCKKIDEFVHSVCIVPGLGFDMKGYRLGYGKGYYDRFLEGYKDKTIGICYNSCLKNLLPHGKYDKPVDILISEKFMKRI
jgi:5-formyltetrahydrofolate cyclo-ligase